MRRLKHPPASQALHCTIPCKPWTITGHRKLGPSPKKESEDSLIAVPDCTTASQSPVLHPSRRGEWSRVTSSGCLLVSLDQPHIDLRNISQQDVLITHQGGCL